MNSLQESFKDVVNMVGIYISEAHAMDEWPLGNIVCINQHKTIEERLTVANDFKDNYHFSVPLLVDTMDNQFDSLYASWPERFYIVRDAKMAFIGIPSTEFGYDRNDIVRWLKGYQNGAQ